MAGHRSGFAGIAALGLQKLLEAGVNAVGHLVQNPDAFIQSHSPPGAVQGRAGRFHSGIHFLAPGLVNPADQLAVGRVHIVEQLPAGGADILSVDEMLNVIHY